jgi:hypothetical protein
LELNLPSHSVVWLLQKATENKKKKVMSERVKKTNRFIGPNVFHLVQIFEEEYRDIFLNGINQVIHV